MDYAYHEDDQGWFDILMFFLYICLMERPVDTLARLIIAVIKAKVYIFVFLLVVFLGAELRQCVG